MDDFYQRAGKNLRKIREEGGFTREELAEWADISPKFLYEIEKGRKGFSANTLYRLANALQVDCEDILSTENKKECREDLEVILSTFNRKQKAELVIALKSISKMVTFNKHI